MQSTRASRHAAALVHLRLLSSDRDHDQDRRYVNLAYLYGVHPNVIAAESGLPIVTVCQILRLGVTVA